jgi:hypothetical protein
MKAPKYWFGFGLPKLDFGDTFAINLEILI